MSVNGLDLSRIAAPMVNQSDLAFRQLVMSHGATLAFSQMLIPRRLLNEQEYLEYWIRDLSLGGEHAISKTVVQLCGNDVQETVSAARKLVGYCAGFDLNLGCPQEHAKAGHYGAYLLDKKGWPLIEQIVSSLSTALPVPVSAKLRLCQPTALTPDLAARLSDAGASFITLHARTVSSRRRRGGAADLSAVKALKEKLGQVKVVSNGNVRCYGDLAKNLEETGADGLMVGETLLGNPCLFDDEVPDPVDISFEYLQLCRTYPCTSPINVASTHVRHFVDFQCGRRPWFNKFRAHLNRAETLDDVGKVLRRVDKWRERPERLKAENDSENEGVW